MRTEAVAFLDDDLIRHAVREWQPRLQRRILTYSGKDLSAMEKEVPG